MPLLRAYGHIRDNVTHEQLEAEPEVFRCKTFQHHPNLPQITKVDLRPKCPPVYNQGNLGSCTANALCGAYRYEMLRQHEKDVDMSRLFLYYAERQLEGTVSQDSGAQLMDGVKVLRTTGVCTDRLWPYVVERFATKPSVSSYANAKLHHVLKAQRLSQDLQDLKQSLVDGFPFVFGFLVFPSFETEEVATTGRVPLPDPDEQPVGGHAVMAVGYDDAYSSFIVRNSWGTDWGLQGYFYLPYDYLTNPELASDFWALQLVKDS